MRQFPASAIDCAEAARFSIRDEVADSDRESREKSRESAQVALPICSIVRIAISTFPQRAQASQVDARHPFGVAQNVMKSAIQDEEKSKCRQQQALLGSDP